MEKLETETEMENRNGKRKRKIGNETLDQLQVIRGVMLYGRFTQGLIGLPQVF